MKDIISKKRLTMKTYHKKLGEVQITETCLAMQKLSCDHTSIYVEHNGEVKEVSKNLVYFELE